MNTRTLLLIVAGNVQEILKKQCTFAQYSETSEYAIMSTDIVSEIKGGKRWAKNDPGYWLQSGSGLLPYLGYSNVVLIDKNRSEFLTTETDESL
jgi:hypothetical protein